MIFGRYIEGPGSQTALGQVAIPAGTQTPGVVSSTGGAGRAQQNAK